MFWFSEWGPSRDSAVLGRLCCWINDSRLQILRPVGAHMGQGVEGDEGGGADWLEGTSDQTIRTTAQVNLKSLWRRFFQPPSRLPRFSFVSPGDADTREGRFARPT
jgi:hypothetical protein